MSRKFHAHRLNLIFGILTLFLISGVINIGSAQAIENDSIGVVDFVYSTFDGVGFADSPGGVSTIESTLNALRLLSEAGLVDSENWEYTYDMISWNIKTHQDTTGGFKTSDDQVRPDIKTTAQSLESLRLMNRLDEDTRLKSFVYLANYFKGGLEFDYWISDGVFEVKYWGLIATEAIGQTSQILNIEPIDLSNVYLPDETIVTPYMNEPHLRLDEVYLPATVFESMTLDEQLRVVESIQILIPHDDQQPTLSNLLINSSSLVERIEQAYDGSSGLWMEEESPSIDFTARIIKTLKTLGKSDEVLSLGIDPNRVSKLRTVVSEHVTGISTIPKGTRSVSETLSSTITHEYIMHVDQRHVEYSPQIQDGSIIGWARASVADYSIPFQKDYNVDSTSINISLLFFAIFVISIVSIGFTHVKDKTLIGLIALALVFMFAAEIWALTIQTSSYTPLVSNPPEPQGRSLLLAYDSANMMWTSNVAVYTGASSVTVQEQAPEEPYTVSNTEAGYFSEEYWNAFTWPASISLESTLRVWEPSIDGYIDLNALELTRWAENIQATDMIDFPVMNPQDGEVYILTLSNVASDMLGSVKERGRATARYKLSSILEIHNALGNGVRTIRSVEDVAPDVTKIISVLDNGRERVDFYEISGLNKFPLEKLQRAAPNGAWARLTFDEIVTRFRRCTPHERGEIMARLTELMPLEFITPILLDPPETSDVNVHSVSELGLVELTNEEVVKDAVALANAAHALDSKSLQSSLYNSKTPPGLPTDLALAMVLASNNMDNIELPDLYTGPLEGESASSRFRGMLGALLDASLEPEGVDVFLNLYRPASENSRRNMMSALDSIDGMVYSPELSEPLTISALDEAGRNDIATDFLDWRSRQSANRMGAIAKYIGPVLFQNEYDQFVILDARADPRTEKYDNSFSIWGGKEGEFRALTGVTAAKIRMNGATSNVRVMLLSVTPEGLYVERTGVLEPRIASVFLHSGSAKEALQKSRALLLSNSEVMDKPWTQNDHQRVLNLLMHVGTTVATPNNAPVNWNEAKSQFDPRVHYIGTLPLVLATAELSGRTVQERGVEGGVERFGAGPAERYQFSYDAVNERGYFIDMTAEYGEALGFALGEDILFRGTESHEQDLGLLGSVANEGIEYDLKSMRMVIEDPLIPIEIVYENDHDRIRWGSIQSLMDWSTSSVIQHAGLVNNPNEILEWASREDMILRTILNDESTRSVLPRALIQLDWVDQNLNGERHLIDGTQYMNKLQGTINYLRSMGAHLRDIGVMGEKGMRTPTFQALRAAGGEIPPYLILEMRLSEIDIEHYNRIRGSEVQDGYILDTSSSEGNTLRGINLGEEFNGPLSVIVEGDRIASPELEFVWSKLESLINDEPAVADLRTIRTLMDRLSAEYTSRSVKDGTIIEEQLGNLWVLALETILGVNPDADLRSAMDGTRRQQILTLFRLGTGLFTSKQHGNLAIEQYKDATGIDQSGWASGYKQQIGIVGINPEEASSYGSYGLTPELMSSFLSSILAGEQLRNEVSGVELQHAYGRTVHSGDVAIIDSEGGFHFLEHKNILNPEGRNALLREPTSGLRPADYVVEGKKSLSFLIQYEGSDGKRKIALVRIDPDTRPAVEEQRLMIAEVLNNYARVTRGLGRLATLAEDRSVESQQMMKTNFLKEIVRALVSGEFVTRRNGEEVPLFDMLEETEYKSQHWPGTVDRITTREFTKTRLDLTRVENSLSNPVWLFLNILGLIDPGPYISDIDTTIFYSLLVFLQNYLGTNYNLLSSFEPAEFVAPELLDYELNELVVPHFIREFMAQCENSTILDFVGRSLGLMAMPEEILDNLADFWSEPFDFVFWNTIPDNGQDVESVPLTTIHSSLDAQGLITQKVTVKHASDFSRMTVALTGTGEVTAYITSDGDSVTGKGVVSDSGLVDIQFDNTLSVYSDSELEISLTAPESVTLWVSDASDGLSVNGAELSDRSLYVQLHGRTDTIGSKKIGVLSRFCADGSTTELLQNTTAYLDGMYSMFPSSFDDLSSVDIYATNLNTTSNETFVEVIRYLDFTGLSILGGLDVNDDVPISILSSDTDMTQLTQMSLLEQGLSSVSVVSHLDALYDERGVLPERGILLVLGDSVNLDLFETGFSTLERWLDIGNQVVFSGQVPFENVKYSASAVIGSRSVLESLAISTGSSARLNVPESFGGQGVFQESCDTYQESGLLTNTLNLGGVEGNYLEASFGAVNEHGSATFALAVSDAGDATRMPYLRFNLTVDGNTIVPYISLDSLRDSSGAGGSNSILTDDGDRVVFQHIEDVEQLVGDPERNYIVYITTDKFNRDLATHNVRLVDSNGASVETSKVRFLEYVNIVQWEEDNNPSRLQKILNSYVGLPDVGAGLAALTGLECVVSAENLHMSSIPLFSLYGFSTTSARYALDVQSIDSDDIVHIYSQDSTGNYGEITFRTGGGLVTVLSPETTESKIQIVEKLTYVLTGAITDLTGYFMTEGTDSGLGVVGESFEGLYAEMTKIEVQTHLSDISSVDHDYSESGRFGTSFSNETVLTVQNATLIYPESNSYAHVEALENATCFQIGVGSLDILDTFLMTQVSLLNTSVELLTTIGGVNSSLGWINSSGLAVFRLQPSIVTNLYFVGYADGESSSIMLHWMQTSSVPALPSTFHALTLSFDSLNGVSIADDMEIGTDSIASVDGSLHLHTYSNQVDDEDSAILDLDGMKRGVSLFLEIQHSLNTTLDVDVYATVLASDEYGSQSVILNLSETSVAIFERIRIPIYQVTSIILTVKSSAGAHDWTVDQIQVVDDCDMGLGFEIPVPLIQDGSGSYKYGFDTLVLETTAVTNYSISIDWLNIPTRYYPFISLDVSGLNLTGAWLDILTHEGTYSFVLNWTSGTLVNLSHLDTIISAIDIIIAGNGIDNGCLEVESIVFSWWAKHVAQRSTLIVEYRTRAMKSNLVFDNHLLSWNLGSLAIVDGDETVSRTTTEILDWTMDTVIVAQTCTNTAGNITYTVMTSLWNDGRIDITLDAGDASLLILLEEPSIVYSDSISLCRNTTDNLIREPLWAALYSEDFGVGLANRDGLKLTASISQGWVKVTSDVGVTPVLEPRFETLGGFEIDANFFVTVSDINPQGLLEDWVGVVESQDVAMWDGLFTTDLVIDEQFNSMGSWVVDATLTTPDVDERTVISSEFGKLNITMECTETATEELVLKLNFIDFIPYEYPFMMFVLEGSGSLSVSISIQFSDETDLIVLTTTPVGPTVEDVNLVALMKSDPSVNKTVVGLAVYITETSPSTDDVKTVFFDSLEVWRLRDWELDKSPELLTVMAVESTAVVENGVLILRTSSDELDSEICLNYRFIQIADTIEYRTLEWRSYVGYTSTMSIGVKNATASYNIDCSSLPWSVFSADLVDEEEKVVGDDIPDMVDEIEICLSTTMGVAGEAHLDWARLVVPYVARYTWDDFADGSFNPLIEFDMMGFSYIPESPNEGPRDSWYDYTYGHTTEVWSSYSADPGSFTNGEHLDLGHNEQVYDYTTWTFGSITRDIGWVDLHSDLTPISVDCGWGSGGMYSQSFYLGVGKSTSSLQVYIRAEEQAGFYGDNIKWFIYTGDSSAPNTGNDIRSGSFDALTTFQWKTISFSSLSSEGWYWISIQGNSCDILDPEGVGGPQPDAPTAYYSKPYWCYTSSSGSDGYRWWTGGSSSNDFLTKVRFYQSVTGSSIFNYDVRVNWHDGSGDHNTSLTASPQTVNHAGADDVWITADSSVTNINPINVKSFYRRQDYSLDAYFITDADMDYTSWRLPYSWSIPTFGDEDASVKGKIIYTKGSDWVYQSCGEGTYSANGNTVTITNIDYGDGITVVFEDAYDRVALGMDSKPEGYFNGGWNLQSDGDLPTEVNFRVYVSTNQYEIGGGWDVTLWEYYSSTMTEMDTLTFAGASGRTNSIYLQQSSGYTPGSVIYTQGKYLSKYMAFVLYDGFYLQEPTENGIVSNVGSSAPWTTSSIEVTITTDWMFNANGVQCIYKQDAGGTEYTLTTPYSYTDIGGASYSTDTTFDFVSQIPGFGESWEGHDIYYKFKQVSWGVSDLTGWSTISVVDDDNVAPTVNILLNANVDDTGGYLGLYDPVTDEIMIYCEVNDIPDTGIENVTTRWRWNDGSWSGWVLMETNTQDEYYYWTPVQWDTVDISHDLDFEIKAWDDDDTPLSTTEVQNDIFVVDDDSIPPEVTSWYNQNTPGVNEDATGSLTFTEASGIYESEWVIQFSWMTDFSVAYNITYGGNFYGTFSINGNTLDYVIDEGNYAEAEAGSPLFVRAYMIDNDLDRGAIDRKGGWSTDQPLNQGAEHSIANAPPLIIVNFMPEIPGYADDALVNIDVLDTSDVNAVSAWYGIGPDSEYVTWTALTVYFDGSGSDHYFYHTTVPESAYDYGDTIWVKVWAQEDAQTELESTEIFSTTVTDTTDPIYDVDSLVGPLGVDWMYYDDNSVTARFGDEVGASGVNNATLHYRIDGGEWLTVQMMVTIDGTSGGFDWVIVEGNIPLRFNTSIDYFVEVFDLVGNTAISETLTVDKIEDDIAPDFVWARMVNCQPDVNASLVVKFYEPPVASGMDWVVVGIGLDPQELTNISMVYDEDADVWRILTNKFSEAEILYYKFYAGDLAGNTMDTDVISYTIQNQAMPEEFEIVNLIEAANSVGTFRTFFSVEDEGIYCISPFYSGGVASITLWLDGWEIPIGAQIWLSKSVHIIMIRIETGEINTGWGVQIMNMKTVTDTSGELFFNTLTPAPSEEMLGVDTLYAGGLISMLDYLGTYSLEGLEGGDFETGLSPWTTDISYPVVVDNSEYYSGAQCVRFPKEASHIDYELNDLHATQLSFAYKRTGTAPQEHCVIVQFLNGQAVVDVFDVENTGGVWEDYILAIPSEFEIDWIRIATLNDSDISSFTYIDSVTLTTTHPAAARWSVELENELEPFTLLDIPYLNEQDWTLNISYAAHSEFLVLYDTLAHLVFDIQGVDDACIQVFAYGVNLTNVTSSVTLDWSVHAGSNTLSLYISGSFTPGGSITAHLEFRNGTDLSITNLGQFSGLAGVTSETYTPRAFVFPGDMNMTTAFGFNMSIDSDLESGLFADLIPLNTDDLTTDVVEFNIPDKFTIFATPIMEVTILSNDTSLMGRLSIEVQQVNGIGTLVESEWFNTTSDGWLTFDLQRLAYEMIGGSGYGVYSMARNLTIQFADIAGDGVPLMHDASIYIGIGFRSRVGYSHNIQPRALPIEGLLSGYDIPTSEYNTTSNAIQGDGALLLGPSCENVTYSANRWITQGQRLTFAANSTPTISLSLIVDQKPYTLTLSDSGIGEGSYQISERKTLQFGWKLYDIELYSAILHIMQEEGVSVGSVWLEYLTLDAVSYTIVDALKLSSDNEVSVRIPYWERNLHWSEDSLGMLILDSVGSVLSSECPIYSVVYDGSSYSTSDSNWYSLVSMSVISEETDTRVTQVMFGGFVTVTDTYLISEAGFISFNRTVMKHYELERYSDEVIGAFEFEDFGSLPSSFRLDDGMVPLVELPGISYIKTPSDRMHVQDIDMVEENVNTQDCFSVSMDDALVDGRSGVNLDSDGDLITLKPEENVDLMWIEYDIHISSTMAQYLHTSIDSFRDCRPVVALQLENGTWLSNIYLDEGLSIHPILVDQYIDRVRIGAEAVSRSGSLTVDWLAIRSKSWAAVDDGSRPVLKDIVISPYLSIDVNQLDWSSVDTDFGSKFNITEEDGYSRFNSVDADTYWHQVYLDDSIEVDINRYSKMQVRLAILGSDIENLGNSVSIGLQYVDGYEWYRLDSDETTDGFVTVDIDVSNLAPHTVTGLALEHWFSQAGGGELDTWFDYILITDDETQEDYVILQRASSFSESFDDVTDWSLSSGTGTVGGVLDVAVYQFDTSAEFASEVNIEFNGESSIKIGLGDITDCSFLELKTIAPDGSIETLASFSGLVANTEIVYYIDSPPMPIASGIILSFAGGVNGEVIVDYITIDSNDGVCLTHQSEVGWTTDNVQVYVDETMSLVFELPEVGSGYTNYTLTQPVSIKDYPVLEIDYVLESGMTSPDLFVGFVDEALNYDDNYWWMSNAFVADDYEHTLLVDLSYWTDERVISGELLDMLSLRGSSNTDGKTLRIISIRFTARSDGWSRVDWDNRGTLDTSALTGATDKGLLTLSATNPEADFSYGQAVNITSLPIALARYIIIDYQTSHQEGIEPHVFAVIDGSEVQTKLPASIFGRKLVIDLAGLVDTHLGVNVTSIGVRLQTGMPIEGDVWLTVRSLELWTTPVSLGGFVDGFNSPALLTQILKSLSISVADDVDAINPILGYVTGGLADIRYRDSSVLNIREFAMEHQAQTRNRTTPPIRNGAVL